MDYRVFLYFPFGFIGGIGAYLIGLPMPFMLGGILGAAVFVLTYERSGDRLPKLSRWVRLVFMSLIGAMIGSRFTSEFLSLLPQFWISGVAIIPFILIALGGNFAMLWKLGGYDKTDAYYASLPGGLVDATALAEQAGADMRVVTAQHFIRIILVVVSIPLLFFVISGDVVGSLAGETLAAADYGRSDVFWIIGIGLVGLFVGRLTRLPVSHMLGPLILALILSITGVINISIPEWMTHLAQFMIGTALGAQFSGMSRRLLMKGLGMGLLSGAFMLLLAAAFALSLVNFVPAGFEPLFISFAAGGLAEMSLIALSLNFNPIVVALHHLVRIFVTVWTGLLLAKVVLKQEHKT